MSVSVFSAAKHICRLSEWRVTNLKLQKILYLAHMSYVGQNNRAPLIDEAFEAWDYGPVVRVLYDAVKMFGSSPIQDIFHGSVKSIDNTAEGAMLTSAWAHLKTKSAGELVEITHWPSGAWAKNYLKGNGRSIISTDDIYDEFCARMAGMPVTPSDAVHENAQ